MGAQLGVPNRRFYPTVASSANNINNANIVNYAPASHNAGRAEVGGIGDSLQVSYVLGGAKLSEGTGQQHGVAARCGECGSAAYINRRRRRRCLPLPWSNERARERRIALT